MSQTSVIRVIFTVDTFTRASLGGGLVRHIGYASEMQKRGVEFEWLTLECDVDEPFQKEKSIRVSVVQVDGTLPLQRRREQLLAAAFARASELPRGTRVVTTDSCGVTWNTTTQIWCARLRGIPSTHNTSMVPGPLPTTRLGNLRLKCIGGLFFNGLAKLIPQTHTIRRFFRNYMGLSDAKMQIIGNGVDLARFSPPDAESRLAARQKLGIPHDAPVILSVGSMIPRKGMDLLIRAWPVVLRQYPQARLIIVGSVGRRSTFMDSAPTLDAYTIETLNLIDALPAPESVMLTRREVEEVSEYYQASDIFTFASEREGLPNVVLEAMACGLPCLLAPYEGFPEPGEELGFPGQHFMPCERSSASLAKGILRLIEQPDERLSLGKNARHWMQEKQDLAPILDQWAEMYRRVAKSL